MLRPPKALWEPSERSVGVTVNNLLPRSGFERTMPDELGRSLSFSLYCFIESLDAMVFSGRLKCRKMFFVHS
ncbi:uncharacterized [Tachysurus ichikawai]